MDEVKITQFSTNMLWIKYIVLSMAYMYQEQEEVGAAEVNASSQQYQALVTSW
jgi:hypothetical protein